jgi:FimV-like protein
MVSNAGRVAIINDKLSREGDLIEGAEVLRIEAGTVHLRMGSERVTVYVGSTAVSNPANNPVARPASNRLAQQSIQEANVPVSETPIATQNFASDQSSSERVKVRPGDTLSGIAQRYLEAGVTTNQVMMGLYAANPESFGGNINLLRAGAILQIPDTNRLLDLPPERATALVMQQMLDWNERARPATRLAQSPRPESYGPVRTGETLSEISQLVAIDGITPFQMMLALFEANPESFNGNINLLHAGATLRIPDPTVLHGRPPAAAIAEVTRQSLEWRFQSPNEAHKTIANRPITAFNRE